MQTPGRPRAAPVCAGGRRAITPRTDTDETKVLPLRDALPPPEDGGVTDEGHRRAAVEAATEPPPCLADGIELIGRYEDSGFKDAPFIARRADGQMIQMPELLYLVAEELDGRRGYPEIAEHVSERFGRELDAELAKVVVEEKLAPLGIVKIPGRADPELKKIDPLLALKFRAAVVPERLVNAITKVFRPLFFTPVVVAVLGSLVTLDVWLFGYHGVAQSVRQTLYDPLFLLLMLGLVVLSAAFHECGHATACAYGGARPGVMGAGVYIVWPAFYTDVTDAYRLGKAGRLRTDLGGVYFNTIFILGTAAAYFATGFEPLLLIIPLQHIEILHQFLPFLRLDGYYIVSDLTGVPDMFTRIKPTLKSLLPWRAADESVKELKPWVRGAVTAYVLTLVPLLGFFLVMTLLNAPRIFATAYDSFRTTAAKLGDAGGAAAALDVVQLIVLVLVPLGLVMMFVQFGRKGFRGAWRVTEGRPAARAAIVVVVSGAAAFAAYAWYPRAAYKPISTAERGTIGGAVNQLSSIPTGHPSVPRTNGATTGEEQGTQQPADQSTQTTTGATTTRTSSSTTTTTTSSSGATTSTTSTAPAAGATTTSAPATTTTATTTTATTTSTP